MIFTDNLLTYVIIYDNIRLRGCASTVQVIQQGERPCPTKCSEQSVSSLGAETVR